MNYFTQIRRYLIFCSWKWERQILHLRNALLRPPVTPYSELPLWPLCSCLQAAKGCWEVMQSGPMKNSCVQL